MGGGKNIEQEKDKGSRKVFDKMEGIYSGRRYLGKKRKSEKHEGINRKI